VSLTFDNAYGSFGSFIENTFSIKRHKLTLENVHPDQLRALGTTPDLPLQVVLGLEKKKKKPKEKKGFGIKERQNNKNT